MSLEATRWAWQCRTEKQTEKFVLLALADRSGKEGTCWPSVNRLVKDTQLNEKTVQSALKGLMQQGLIEDTGQRVGVTRRVKVYRLTPRTNVLAQNENTLDKNGTAECQWPEADKTTKTGLVPKECMKDAQTGGFETTRKRSTETIRQEPFPKQNLSGVGALHSDRHLCPVPSNFVVTDEMHTWLKQHGFSLNILDETNRFLDHHRAKGSVMVCWESAWRLWMRNAALFAANRKRPAMGKQQIRQSLNDIHDMDW